MTVVDDAEKLVARMSRAEKAQLMQTIARDLGDAIPGIERTPGVMGGSLHQANPHFRLDPGGNAAPWGH